jgi:opacity protein-like surface antigen
MKSGLSATALVAAMAFAGPALHAEGSGAFVSVDAGRSRLGVSELEFGDRTDTAYAVLGGYRWSITRSLALGIEGGYAYLGKAKDQSTSAYTLQGVDGPHQLRGDDYRYDESRAAMLGMNVRWELPAHWSVTAHGGAAHYRTNFVIDSHFSFDNLSDSDRYEAKHSNNDFYYGFGVAYDVSSHLSLAATYARYSPVFEYVPGDTATHTVTVIGARAEYRF